MHKHKYVRQPDDVYVDRDDFVRERVAVYKCKVCKDIRYKRLRLPKVPRSFLDSSFPYGSNFHLLCAKGTLTRTLET
jgi:hypothetical protein